MSERFPGGIISKTAPVPTGPYDNGTAPGVWTLDQQAAYVKQGIWPLAGNSVPYIEDVFSTWLYTGNGSTQTITNGIDLAGKGGLVWIKSRSANTAHFLFDTSRGVLNEMNSNSTAAQASLANSLTAFNANGFALGSAAGINVNAATYVSWTFRKQPKFFDVVTYSGNAQVSQVINHNLGSVPGCIIVKAVSGASGTASWNVYHRSVGNTSAMQLNTTDAPTASISYWRNTDPTATQFTVGGVLNDLSTNFVAYLFAHNAGGFGLTDTDNVISCGSYTGNGNATGPVINLGYEPQWLLVKNASVSGHYWHIVDTMRGWTDGGTEATLLANTTDAENGLTGAASYSSPTSTGFKIEAASGEVNTSGATYIYIAIRRGPMKVPTTGTSVFIPVSSTPSGASTVTTNFPVDLSMSVIQSANPANFRLAMDRLRGSSTTSAAGLFLNLTNIENAYNNGMGLQSNTTIVDNFWNTLQGATTPVIYWNFRRAPQFFDEVCYAGTSVARTQAHNLSVAPEFLIVKNRSAVAQWFCYVAPLGIDNYVLLNGTAAATSGGGAALWNSTLPTASVFSLSNTINTNRSGDNYVAYLFATCAGVSKVGSYTGTGTTLQVNCGFTAGARFVLIKRTDSTGDWYVWDSARGIIAGNDPYILLNDTSAQVTNTDYVDTYSAGFEISSTAPAAINASGGTFIFLAIA